MMVLPASKSDTHHGWDSWTRTNEMQESKSCAFTNLAISHYEFFLKKALKVFTFKAFCVSIELSSRLVSKQVLSPLQSLTSVFGMGTGGPFAFETLTLKQVLPRLLFDPFGSLISSPSCDAASISPNIFAWLRRLAGGAPSGIRTRDPLIKSQLLYQLS